MKKVNLFILIIISIIGISCSEDSPIQPQDHYAAEGWVFIDGTGARVLKIFRGKVDTNISKFFEVPLGGFSDHYKIKFLDANEKEIDPPTDSNKHLKWDISNPDAFEITRHDNQEWELHFKGKKVDTGSVQFHIFHIDHSDVRSGFIKVKVVDKGDINGDAVGCVLLDEETETKLAQYYKDGVVTGEIKLKPNDTTDHIAVKFMNETWDGDLGELFQPNSNDYKIEVLTSNTDIIQLILPDDSEPFSFKVIGKKIGSAKITIRLIYKGTLKIEFKNLPVKIEN